MPDQSGQLAAVAASITAGASGRWLRTLAQWGLTARAVVYLLLGYLTLRIALAAVGGRTAEPASSAGAVQEAARQTWGQVTLLLLAAGFACYALNQLVEAIFRPGRAAGRMNRWRMRAVSCFGCLLYVAFCISTLSLLDSFGRKSGTAGSEQRQDTALTATLLHSGPGHLLVWVAGALFVLSGLELGRRSVKLTFQERFVAELHPPWIGIVIRVLGAFGCVARATVFVLVGVFILKAAALGEARQTKGLDATFRSVAHSAYGRVTLTVLSLGLLSYGLYCLLEARYRDLTPGR